MKNVHAKSRKAIWLTALGLFAMVAGPTVASLGLDSAIAKVIAPAGATTSNFGYQANLIMGNDKKESTSGTMNLADGKQTEIRLGALQMQITSHKVSEGWKFAIETRDQRTNKVVQASTVITTETEGTRFESKSDDAKVDDVKAFSLSLSPIATKPAANGEKTAGLMQSSDMVTLNFKDPTDIVLIRKFDNLLPKRQ